MNFFGAVRITLAIFFGSVAVASAQDFTTCSGNRDACVAGVKARGANPSLCIAAYKTCMQTGIWDTGSGNFARHLTEVEKR